MRVDRNTESPNRRTALKIIGTGSLGLVSIGSATAEGSSQSVPHRALRGRVEDPIEISEVEKVRESFAQEHVGQNEIGPNSDTKQAQQATLDAASAFGEDDVLGYNVLLNEEGVLKEQYVTQEPLSSEAGRILQNDATQKTEHFRNQADELLETAIDEAEQSSSQSVTQSSTDVDWDEWWRVGSTDIYHEFSDDREYQTRCG